MIIQIAKVIKFTTNVDFKGIQEALLKEIHNSKKEVFMKVRVIDNAMCSGRSTWSMQYMKKKVRGLYMCKEIEGNKIKDQAE